MNVFNNNRRPLIWVFPVIVIVMILFINRGLSNVIQYDRLAIEKGEIWRIFTCHFMHISFEHLYLDAIMFFVIGYAVVKKNLRKYVICMIFSIVIIPMSIYVFLPNLNFYQGLSGLDSAIYVLFITLLLKESLKEKNIKKIIIVIFLYLLIFGKIMYELNTLNTLFADIKSANMIPVPLAHLIGALVGFLVGIINIISKRYDFR